ncbi:CRE-SRZ-12 protein [Caenorhabditis remanei]|uniref:CRE-SRZ-12 protein n=1 Tax=Caenorhabditis remanei TaxID=31234 RepID=E3MBA3_CAERE|nr:CRE-SRZ-12 protein [Caenorhabditis remanei]
MTFLESYNDTYQTPCNSTTDDLKRFLFKANELIWFGIIETCAFVQIILFPFYIYVHRVNNKKDREIPIYPILNHFYHSLKFHIILLLLSVIAFNIFKYFVKDISKNTTIAIILLSYAIFFSATRYMFVKVYVMLLSILAIQRFVLYFYPTSENLWLFKKKCSRLLIYLVYFLVVGEECIYYKRVYLYGAAALFGPASSNSSLFNIHVILGILLISSIMLYIPIYLSVQKLSHLMSSQLNKPHRFLFWQTVFLAVGKVIPIYPILKHFYHSMIYQTILLLWSLFDLILLIYFLTDFLFTKYLTIQIIVTIPVLVFTFTRYIFVKVCVILLSILAIQRFVLYFYPTSEKYWMFKKSWLRWQTYLVYFLVAYEDCFYYKRVFVSGGDPSNGSFFNMHTFLAILLISSSMLYIPIYVTVRKLSHLMSSQLNKPHRYIFWQTVILTIGKVVSLIPVLIYGSLGESKDFIFVCYSFIEMFYVPLVIQLTYLGCNRRNLKTFLNSVKSTKIWKRMCCCASSRTRSSQVQPYVIYDPQSTNHQLTN